MYLDTVFIAVFFLWNKPSDYDLFCWFIRNTPLFNS